VWPPLDPHDPSCPLNVRVPSKVYDKLYRDARHDRVSIPEYIRRMLARADVARHGDKE
jgi:hypothetical protein